jgi:hypothetical protein
LIIHLLNRQRYKRRPWAAMEFLLAAFKKQAPPPAHRERSAPAAALRDPDHRRLRHRAAP